LEDQLAVSQWGTNRTNLQLLTTRYRPFRRCFKNRHPKPGWRFFFGSCNEILVENERSFTHRIWTCCHIPLDLDENESDEGIDPLIPENEASSKK
jgi:hypothetical protein